MPCSRLIAVAVAVLSAAAADARGFDFRPELTLEARLFPDSPALPGQHDTLQAGLVIGGDGRWRSRDRNSRVLFEPYLRLDSEDPERTYFDLRELSFAREFDNWDLLLGVSQVFWGVAESRNVVDVINQFDTIEDVDEGEKLGQPMVRLSRRDNWGTLEFFYLPYFRERPFAGADGRLRFGPVVDTDAARYERSGDEWAGDVALRYGNRFGGIDLGLHAFYGTSRNPLLEADTAGTRLIPLYQRLRQAGLDIQYTTGPWLWKAEAVLARIDGDTFLSGVGGLEYTYFDVAGQGIDIGIIAEYLYDNRDPLKAPINVFDNEVFVGTRITWNDTQDTELLAGAIVDDVTGAVQASIEFQRRLGDRMLLELEARSFSSSGDALLQPFDKDDYITARLAVYF